MKTTDCRGLSLTGAGSKEAQEFDRIHLDSLVFRGDPTGDMARLVERKPDFVMGHCFVAAMLTQQMEARVSDELIASVDAAYAHWTEANDRERGHIAALRQWAGGDFYAAVRTWAKVLDEYPQDLLALQLVHLSYVLLGNPEGQRDCVEKVLPHWDETTPGYEFVLGFQSFGLEETGDYAQAYDVSRRAIDMRPGHPYALHSVAHILEMQGRQQDGIAWMKERRDDWAHSGFANHMWWHLALYHVDLLQYDRVLEIYDTQMRVHEDDPGRFEDLDSSSLLWRLEMLGVDVGDRWQVLADRWTDSAEDTVYAFNDMHAMICFTAAAREEDASRLLAANERHISQTNDTNAFMSRYAGLPICRALDHFSKGNYGCAADLLGEAHRVNHVIGGSHAQRDIVEWTLIEANLRSGRHADAGALAEKRVATKPSSPQNWNLLARALDSLGKKRDAATAQQKMQIHMAMA